MSTELNLNLSMFRAYDIRTPSSALTPELAERLSRAEARYFLETLGVDRVLLAHDARSSGPAYLTIAADIYQQAGLEVLYMPGVTSTSHFYFTAMQHPDAAAVMCGASHNPAGDTGRKTLGPNVQPIAEHIGRAGGLDQIKAFYIEDGPLKPDEPGGIRPIDSLDDYIEYSMELAGVEPGSLQGVQIFHDYLFGAGGREMMLAFERAGAALTPLHFAPDGSFPLGDPNPVKAGVIQPGLDRLKDGKFLLGTFFDGDADRVDFYSGDGRYLSSSFVYAGILPQLRKRFPGSGYGVYADLKSNPLALIEMARTGFRVGVMRNGHSQIKNALIEDTAMVGAVEESAHFYESFMVNGAGPYSTENTLYIALLTAKSWYVNPRRFEQLFEIQAQTSREREWGHHFTSDTDRERALDAVRNHFVSAGAAARSSTQNGMDLEATMMRRGLPFEIDQNTTLDEGWVQICQRISQSENGLARWEVVSGSPTVSAEAKALIIEIVMALGGSAPYVG